MAVWLAESKLAQLRSLTWSVRFVDGLPMWQQDETTDLSAEPVRSGGGGTRVSPVGVMEGPVPGYVDYLDRDGRWIDRGALAVGTVPDGAAYERRWAIERVGSGGAQLLVFQVAVAGLVDLRDAGAVDWRVSPAVVWISGARLRRAR
jgi:hypothetical protein